MNYCKRDEHVRTFYEWRNGRYTSSVIIDSYVLLLNSCIYVFSLTRVLWRDCDLHYFSSMYCAIIQHEKLLERKSEGNQE